MEFASLTDGNVEVKSDSSLRKAFLKRAFDIFWSSVGLLILSPIGLILAILVKLSDGGPIFYGQTRIGQFGKPFRIWKFRSMVVNADKMGLQVTQGADRRITRIGRLLRRTKLDELPQLWNVLVGEMSFVGPRPEVARYVDRYTPEQRQILQYKPGITDMASMLFRNEEALLRGSSDVEAFYLRYCMPKKIELNQQYAKQANVIQDVWIILQTLCPYWVGVAGIYFLALVFSFRFAYELRFDFQVPAVADEEFMRCVPWMVTPQLVLLIWRAQLRGLMSYFSLPDLKRIGSALGLAFFTQLAIRFVSHGRFAPTVSILLLHLILSLVLLGGMRLALRLVRERASRSKSKSAVTWWRVAVVGTGDIATRLAVELGNDGNGARQVVAFFDDNPRMWNKLPHGVPVVGMPECLLNSEWHSKIDEVIIALPEDEAERSREIGEMLKGTSVTVSYATAWPVLKPLEV